MGREYMVSLSILFEVVPSERLESLQASLPRMRCRV